MKIVLVTGSRNWPDDAAVEIALSAEMPDIVVHGACPTGADNIADAWAAIWDVPAVSFPALWDEHGKAAGPMRNAEMVGLLDLLRIYGHQVLVLAFVEPGSRGTRDCMAKARAKGLRVVEHVVDHGEAP